MMGEVGKRIIIRAQGGEHKAFSRLVDFYHQGVYQICYTVISDAYEAETLAESTFLHVYETFGCYDRKRKFSLWLYQTVVALLMDYLNKNPHDHYEGQNGWDVTLKALMTLPVEERLALILLSTDKLSVKEISEIMDTPMSTIKTYIRHGRERYVRIIEYGGETYETNR